MESKFDDEFGIERLRRAVHILDQCNEGFNQQFSAEELLKLVDAQLRSDWDVFIDQYSDRQIEEALQGIVPDFEQDERGRLQPKYNTKEK